MNMPNSHELQKEPKKQGRIQSIMRKTAAIAVKALVAMIGSGVLTIIFTIINLYFFAKYRLNNLPEPIPGEKDLGAAFIFSSWLMFTILINWIFFIITSIVLFVIIVKRFGRDKNGN
mgnify:CR=1 FL=1